MNQISFFELIETDEAPQFPESDFAEIVGYISNRLGLNFKKKDGILEKTSSDDPEPSNYYEAKVKKGLRLTLSKGKFFPEVNNGAYFIGVGYDIDNRAGGSAPLDTVGEALDYFEYVLNKYK